MAELIRSFPDRPIPAAQYDPNVGALYRRVREELARQGTGTLAVKLDDPAANVFADEAFIGSGTAKLSDLPPGRRRIYVARGEEPGRVHEIDVPPRGTASLEISWALDGALRTAGSVVSLQVDESAGADAEVQQATALGRALGVKTVVVLSVRPINGRRAITGYSIDVESQTRRYGALQIEPIAPSTQTVAQLAALLAGDKNVDANGIITTEPAAALPPIPPTRETTDETNWYDDHLALLLGGAGLVLLGGGAYAEVHASSLDDQASLQTMQTERQRLQDQAASYRSTGEVLLITGGVAVAAGIVKHVLFPPRPTTARAVALDIAPAWIGISARF
jgi:hypothetical protein